MNKYAPPSDYNRSLSTTIKKQWNDKWMLAFLLSRTHNLTNNDLIITKCEQYMYQTFNLTSFWNCETAPI